MVVTRLRERVPVLKKLSVISNEFLLLSYLTEAVLFGGTTLSTRLSLSFGHVPKLEMQLQDENPTELITFIFLISSFGGLND
ncbi:hypothetical protein V5O48_017793, partial [Marasmius crinis-equi]